MPEGKSPFDILTAIYNFVSVFMVLLTGAARGIIEDMIGLVDIKGYQVEDQL